MVSHDEARQFTAKANRLTSLSIPLQDAQFSFVLHFAFVVHKEFRF
jgi:hypothetical protein